MIDKCPICGGKAGENWNDEIATDHDIPYFGCSACGIMIVYQWYEPLDKERAERLWDTIATALLKQNGA